MTNKYRVGFYFELSYQGENLAFKEVSGISMEMRVVEIMEGGENRFKHRVPAVTSYNNLVLKRCIAPRNSKLLQWCADSIENGLTKPIVPRDIIVNLLNAQGEVVISWQFYQAYPVKYAIANFDSNDAVLIEALELAYTYFKTN